MMAVTMPLPTLSNALLGLAILYFAKLVIYISQKGVCTASSRPEAKPDNWKPAGSATTWIAGVDSLVDAQRVIRYVITVA